MVDARMTRCIQGDDTPRCMGSHRPADVVSRIEQAFWAELQPLGRLKVVPDSGAANANWALHA